ncbi:MAG: hypothetical protein WA902_22025, partial [Thermosynechococcaceae cyanobacterium]
DDSEAVRISVRLSIGATWFDSIALYTMGSFLVASSKTVRTIVISQVLQLPFDELLEAQTIFASAIQERYQQER